MVLSGMIPSFGEVQATALKAARGAGLPWGLCEEASAATRWLWVHGFDGVSAVAAVLENYDADLCPLRVATRIADGTPLPWQGRVRAPLMLLPSVMGRQATLQVDGQLTDFGVADVRVEASGGQPDPVRVGRRPVDPDAWKLLKRLEGRTYAPPTEASRAGAGAGLTDND